MKDELKQNLIGRTRIYTDVEHIDDKNIIEIVSKTYIEHQKNANDCRKLEMIEKGEQSLLRDKKVREDIDIKDVCNLPHYITAFKLGYNWGNPISYVHRKDIDNKNDEAINTLNNMLDLEGFQNKNQIMFQSMEITALGYYFVDVRRETVENGAIFDIVPIDPQYCYKVYLNDITETPVLDVIFRRLKSGKILFSCYTKDRYFEIVDLRKIENGKETDINLGEHSGEKNILGKLPLVEFRRAEDLMGCFEREIGSIQTVSTMNSDFADAVAQDVQGINWANDVDFPKDENGKDVAPKSNQWLLTKTTSDGKTPIIKPIQFSIDYSSTLNKINYATNSILQRCFVPNMVEMNGGSSGSAMSMSAGWTQAEANASRQEQIVRQPLLQLLDLLLTVAKIKKDPRLTKLNINEIEPRIVRNKTYDLATKVNSCCALLSHGISLKDALIMCDMSGDVAQIIENSKESVEKFQNHLFGDNKQNVVQKNNLEQVKNAMGRTGLQDMGDQDNNTPTLKGVVNYKKTEKS